ncbi:MAG: GAF domain-containing protein [Planctomycetes bacterium]|nr:GAF domain-containing protein [Planctomycetota bacterium]
MSTSPEDKSSALLVSFLKEVKPDAMEAWTAEVKALPHAQQLTATIGEEAFQERMSSFYDLIVDHIANPDTAIGGEFLPQLMWQALDSDSSPTDIARVEMLLKKTVMSLLVARFGADWRTLSKLCSRFEAEIDEARLRTHELYRKYSVARLQEVELRSEVYAAVSRISLGIISASSMEKIASLLAKELSGLIRFDCLVIGLLRDNNANMEVHAVRLPDTQGPPRSEIVPRGDLVLGQASQQKEPIRIDEVSEKTLDPWLSEFGIQSYITSPLQLQDQTLGAILLGAYTPRAYSNTDTNALRRIADEVTTAINHLRLTEMSKRRSAELAMINEVSTLVGADVELHELLDAVASVVQQTFAYYDVGLFLVDKEAGEVVMRGQAGAFGDLMQQGYRQKIGEGMVGWVAQQGEPLVANDVTKEPRHIIAHDAERKGRSELCVPIKIRGEVVGVINVECTRLAAFDERDVTAMQMISRIIADGVEAARLRMEAREAQRRLTHMMTHLPIGVGAIDMNGVYTYWSTGNERMLGYTAQEMIGKKKHGFQTPGGFNVEDLLSECRTWGSVQMERPMRTKDGRDLWVYEALANLYDDSGNQIGFTVCLQDVTERKRAEDEARREQENLTNVLTAMGAGVSLIDRNMRVVWANKAVVDWFRPGADVTGMHCFELYHGYSTICKGCVALETFDTGEVRREEHVNYTSDGKRRHFLSVVTPIRDTNGKVTQVLKLSQDITNHAERMEELNLIRELSAVMQETLERDRAIFAALTCVTAGAAIGFNRAFLWLRNTESHTLDGTMAVGPASAEDAARIWRKAEAERKSLRQILAEYDTMANQPETTLNHILRSLNFSLDDTAQIPVLAVREKQPIFVADAEKDPRTNEQIRSALNLQQFVCVPLIARGEAIGAILADNLYSGKPITDQQISMLNMFAARAGLTIDNAEAYQRLEDNYHQLAETRDRLVRSERLAAIGNMAAHVAHEIRNPLVTIGGFARSITRQATNHSPIAQAAEIIAEEVSRLERILANVLNFTKPAEPKKERTNLNQLINEVCEFVQPQFAQAQVELHRDLTEGIPDVMVDPGQIRQVLLNLLRNGLDSLRTQAGGRITIATRLQEDYLKIEVRDTGEGMSPEVLENMFNPFFTKKPDGTGLGLAVTRKVVEDHGGDIFVESTVGEGTTFNLMLPLTHEHVQSL